MPTFDFANIVRQLLRASLKFVSNPFTLFTTFVVSFGTFSTLVTNFISDNISFISSVSFDSFTDNDPSGLMSLISFCMNFDTLETVVNAFITVINTLVTFLPGAFGGFLTAIVVYKVALAARNSMKDIAG